MKRYQFRVILNTSESSASTWPVTYAHHPDCHNVKRMRRWYEPSVTVLPVAENIQRALDRYNDPNDSEQIRDVQRVVFFKAHTAQCCAKKFAEQR